MKAPILFDPRRALQAARTLASDPDDLPQVFTIIDSLSLDTLGRIHDGFTKTAEGRRLLETRPDIVDRLADRESLARAPEGSLARAYLSFVERENISAQGIRDAGTKGAAREKPLSPSHEWVHNRMRDTHDLWHAAVGYHGDVLGETALLAFTFAQTWNPAIGLITGIGLVLSTRGSLDAKKTIVDGFRRGRKAEWLPGVNWEPLLDLPLEEVRRRLSLEAPPMYTPVRSSQLRAQRMAA
jgi:ubiquinone biosynthesis protein COQ4